MKQSIYFDNASTTPLLPEVIEEMTMVMQSEYGNPSSIHARGRQSKAIIERSRKAIAEILNCSVGEVFFTSSATESNNAIIKSAVATLGVKRIISTLSEHPCVVNTIEDIDDIEVVYLDLNNHGAINLGQLEDLLKSSDVKTLISLMYVNNEIGIIHPVQAISDLAKEYGALYHSDAVQAIGKVPIDLQKTKIHFMSASAHKFHGPKGVGMMYLGGEYNMASFIKGGAQERNMRAGTENIYGIAGMTKALDLAVANMDERQQHIRSLRTYMIERLHSNFQDILINGAGTDTAAHILSVSFPYTERVELLMFNLDINGICASAGSACSSGVEHDSPVLAAIGHDPKRKTIRFSFSHDNTLAEVDQLIEILRKLTPLKEVAATTV